MNRLAVMRAYFIERFFAALQSDPEFPGLTQPAELFDDAGVFTVSADEAGFARIPSPAAVRSRMQSASGAEHEHLERFERVLTRALGELAAAGPLDSRWITRLAERFCPYIHHRPEQRFLPVNMADYLRVKELGLESRLYTVNGQRNLAGDIPGALFDNPEVWSAPPPSPAPYTAKVPFVASVGVGTALPGYPATSLKFGQLDLSAADVRLSPSRMAPTIYVEAKTLYGALRINQSYRSAAAGGGRFVPLRNNRVHEDPVLTDRLLEAAVSRTAMLTTAAARQLPADGLMLVYHLFYPLDDGARRDPGLLATNREFHHLAVALLFDSVTATLDGHRPSLVFTSRGPDNVKAMSFLHPSLTRLRDDGEPDADGDHVVGFSKSEGERRRARIELKNETLEKQQEAAKERGEASSDKATANAAAAGGMAASGVALVAGSPAAALVLFALAALLALLGHKLGSDREERAAELEHEAGQADSAADKLADDAEEWKDEDRKRDLAWYERAVGPRRVVLEVIPHGADRNLYGLRAEGADTLRIEDDAKLREMLAWWSFPGGIGYQFDCPGARDAPGSSFRNYFQLFLEKLIELREAQTKVTYFDS